MAILNRWPIGVDPLSNGAWVAVWQRWLTSLVAAVNLAPAVIGVVALEAQVAAVVTTSVALPSLPKGLYRLTYYIRKTVVGATSTLTVTLSWTDGAVACAQAFAALTTNTTAATQTDSILVRADAGSSLSYAIAYGSTGTPLQFQFDLLVEEMPT